ncbi:hypothetical protein [Nocardioides alcanivorans]|uniref:hypothetical protein n=1 Tax=Nocardioides alcanivorans TaxID=2897352 RepID=UPI001F26334E|nr:hypothetical protein [Nocardioides alcanivorans]
MSGVVMSHQLLAYEVQVDRDDRVRLRVTQRLAWAVATSNGAARKLPHDGAQVQEVVLRKVGEEWLVVRVRSVPPEEPVSQLR